MRGVSKVPPGRVMGTLDMLGSNFSHFLNLMGICLVDGVAGWRRLVGVNFLGTFYLALPEIVVNLEYGWACCLRVMRMRDCGGGELGARVEGCSQTAEPKECETLLVGYIKSYELKIFENRVA